MTRMRKEGCRVATPSVGASRLVGDPVDIITGAVIDQDTDFRLPSARLPLSWVRHYDSRRATHEIGIGCGFRHALAHELRFDLDGLTYIDPTGSETSFAFLSHDGERAREQGIVLERAGKTSYRIELPDAQRLHFSFRAGARTGRLDVIQLREQYLTLRYDDRSQQLQSVGLGDLGHLRVEWEQDRIARVILAEPEPKAEQVVALYRYDARGCLLEARGLYKHTLKYAYDDNQRLLRKTDRRGYAFHYAYDRDGRCIESRGEDGAEAVQLEYRPTERSTIVTHHDDGRWQYQYSDAGVITNILEPCGGMQSYVTDEQGRVVSEVDPVGNETLVSYDDHGVARSKIDLWGYRLPLDADAEPAPHPLEHRTPSTALECMYGSAFAAPQRIPVTGDPLWNVPWQARRVLVAAEPEWGGRVRRELSVLGTPLRDRREDGKTRRWAYDENSNLRWLQDFDGGKRSFEYVSDNHLAHEIHEVGGVTRFEHTPNGLLASITDPGGTRSEYLRDQNGRVIEVRRNGQTRERYGYDLAGNLCKKWDAQGVLLLDLTIGRGGLEVARKLNGGEMQRFERDERGRLVEASGAAGRCTFAYASDGQRTAELRDELGVIHSDSSTTVLGKLVTRFATSRSSVRITDPTGRSHELREIASGVLEVRLGNGAREISQFDVDGRCLSKTLMRFGDDDRPWQRSFRYSGEGDLLERRDNERGDSSYQYDARHRLIRVARAGGVIETYEHDLADNLVRTPSPFEEARSLDLGQRHELQAGNRLLQVGGERFYYDQRGHVSKRETAYGSTLYLRDALDQLTTVRGRGLELSAEYDPLGRRTRKIANGRTTTYYWDGDRLAAELLPGGGVRVYIYGSRLAMVPLLFVDYSGIDAAPESGTPYYVVTDHRGAVERILNDRSETAWSARVDPYGYTIVETGRHFYMPLRFPGHFYDAESGLHYNRFRYYDPALGRYLESDPQGIEGGRNLYSYTKNPLREVDLRGLSGTKQCTDCQSGGDKTAASEGHPKKESDKDAEPAVLPENPKLPKTSADDSPWPPRTVEANHAAHQVADAVTQANAKHKAEHGLVLIGKKSGAVIAVRTHADGSRSAGISGVEPHQAKQVEKQLNSSPEAQQWKRDNDGKDQWKVRGDVDPELANKPSASQIDADNCAEPRAASAARGNESPQTGHDIVERDGSKRALDSDAGQPNPHAVQPDDSRKLDGADRQLQPCTNCQTHADAYNGHAKGE